MLLSASTLLLNVALMPTLTVHAQDIYYGFKADDCNLVKAASSPEAYAKLTEKRENAAELEIEANRCVLTGGIYRKWSGIWSAQ